MKKLINSIEKNKIFLLLSLILIFCLVVLFILIKNGEEKRKNDILIKNNKIRVEKIRKTKKIKWKNTFIRNMKSLDIKADSFLVQDLNSPDILYSKNYQKKQSIASLTKIMTALLALENKNLQKIVIDKKDLIPEGEYFLQPGEIFDKKDLVVFMLANSSNDAARALANSNSENVQKFIDKMNDFSIKIGLNSTLFFSDTGLDAANRIGGSYSSVQDINKLILYFYKNFPKVSEQVAKFNIKICSNKICHDIENTNKLLTEKNNILFSKTGYTNFSGGSLALIIKIKDRLYSIVILKSTKDGRFKDAGKIINSLTNLVENVD